MSFLLYNGSTSTRVTNSTICDHLNFSRPIVVFIHGWNQDGYEDFIEQMATAYFESTTKVNFLVINWEALAFKNYFTAAFSVQSIGEITGRLIYTISKNFKDLQSKKQYFDNVHIIGHSLGAHIGGIASKFLQKKAYITLGRVTGLDAAGPLFTFPFLIPSKYRLSKKDAQFVDLIHTDILLAGTALALGHADFYVNFGGPIQPACFKKIFSFFTGGQTTSESINSKKPQIFIHFSVQCSHEKAVKYYTYSINHPQAYEGVKWKLCTSTIICNETAFMGENADPSKRGSFFVSTDPDVILQK